MNIWALDKDLHIKHLLLMLSERLGAQSFAISSVPALDPMAIRIYKPGEPDICAYLFTYGQAGGRYGAHLEYPVFTDTDVSMAVEIKENLDFEQLAGILQSHLDVIVEKV